MKIKSTNLWLLAASAIALQASPSIAQTNDLESSKHASEWLSRVFMNFDWETNQKAQFSAETIQPLLQSGQHTIFVQGRVAYSDSDWTINGGLGYRYLMPDGSWLFGTNAFWDGTTEDAHRRWGIGAEAIGQVLTFRGNYYDAYSGWRTVEETATYRVEEKAMDGFDASVESQFPYMPWVRVEAGYYQWDVTTAGNDDVQGFRSRVQLDLTSFTRLEGTFADDNYDTRYGVAVSVALGAPREIQFSAVDTGFTSTAVFNNRDLERQRLARVKRENDIVVERRTINKVTGGLSGGVTIGRSG